MTEAAEAAVEGCVARVDRMEVGLVVAKCGEGWAVLTAKDVTKVAERAPEAKEKEVAAEGEMAQQRVEEAREVAARVVATEVAVAIAVRAAGVVLLVTAAAAAAATAAAAMAMAAEAMAAAVTEVEAMAMAVAEMATTAEMAAEEGKMVSVTVEETVLEVQVRAAAVEADAARVGCMEPAVVMVRGMAAVVAT